MTGTGPVHPRLSLGRTTITVRRASRHELVEFELQLGDPDLSIELLLPFPQFRELCERHDAALTVTDAALADWLRLAERHGAQEFVNQRGVGPRSGGER